MKTTTSVLHLERKIDDLRQQLLVLGSIHPGSISEQYHVCKNPGCCCMDPKKPQPHGPYHKLAYVHRGKQACRFVREECLKQIKSRLANYKTFRSIMDQWIALSIECGVIEFFSKPSAKRTQPKPNHRGKARKSIPKSKS
jgi:hypothetical protein